MRLTWKDGLATVLTAGIVALYVAFVAGADLPLLSSARGIAVAALVLGIGGCAAGGAGAAVSSPSRVDRIFMAIAGVLGAAAFIAVLATLITGSTILLTVLVATVVALWLVATTRHLSGGTVGKPDPDTGLRRMVGEKKLSKL